MYNEIKNDNIIVNGEIVNIKERDIISLIEKRPMYEVFRIIDGKILYLKETLSFCFIKFITNLF